MSRNTDKLLSGPMLKAILGAGWQPVTYRQNTELQIEAWHWNPRGTWSDPQKQEGYFIGSAEPRGEDSAFVGVSAAASRRYRRRRRWMVSADGWQPEELLEEQSRT